MWLLVLQPAYGQHFEDELRISVSRLGPGNIAREGSWTGIRLEVSDQGLASQREIVLRIRVPDPDGDSCDYDRVVTSNAGLAQAFWVYACLPTANSGINQLDVLAYEAVESSNDERFGFRAGRLLGRTTIPLARVVPPTRGVMGLVGSSRMGLDDYGPQSEFPAFLPMGHELTLLASGMDVSDIPDRWQGLGSMETLCWASTSGRTDPGLLSPDKARAIREWVERGGHLVVVLPSIGQEWFSQTGNPLASLLPKIKPAQTLEGVDLNAYRALLTSDMSIDLPRNGIVRTFEPAADAGPYDAMPILNDAEGRCVVVRRLVGSGAVTLIGIDLTLSGLRALGLPEAEVFWHRVLGRRGSLGPADEFVQSGAVQFKARLQSRSQVRLDVDLDDFIAMRGTAAVGVALGFIVFTFYWLIAGPLGFYLLGRAGMKQHAWSAFVGSVILFTGISWLGATVSKPHRALVRHITLLKAVHGQEIQRARSWVALLSPFYGDAQVSVKSEDGANLISAMHSSSAGLLGGGFPDNRSYRMETRRPDEIIFPSRSTVKELQLEWAGRASWSMPDPIRQPGDLNEPKLRLTEPGEADENGTIVDYEVHGELMHQLPAPLEDVVVLVNTGQITIQEGARIDGKLTGNVLAYELAGPWAPNVPLSMAEVTRRAESVDVKRRRAGFAYLSELLAAERITAGAGNRPDPRRLSDRLKALALFPQLEPPNFTAGPGVGDRLAMRSRTHGMDLGLWFTQPCVMVLGQVNQSGRDARSVVPLLLGGNEVPCEGLTYIMWVYPLEPKPPMVRAAASAG